jgi:histidyl-tRNA synthetase
MNTKKIDPRLLKGFRDYLPDQMIPRQRMMNAAAEVFERYGFAPLQTPALEYAEILLGKYGADAERLLYKFTDNGGREVCMRYDLTVPLARVAAQYGNLPLPFKRYQIAPVWRAEKPGKGRYREFFQCDVDIVGSSSLLADAECVAVDNDVLATLGVTNFQIRINNRKILTGWFEALQLGNADDDAGRGILRTIDKLPAMGEETVRKLLASDNGLDAGAVDRVFEFLGISGANEEMLARATELIGASEAGAQGLAELRTVIECAQALGVPAERLQVDFSIARGLDYYTGSVFETFLLDLPGFGSVMSGGRYDNLISTFLGRDMPAVGISAGVDRLFAGMLELGLIDDAATTTRVLVAPMDEAVLPTALGIAAQLRAAGLGTEVYPEQSKLKKQLKYANQRGIPVVVIIGLDELAAGEATVKMMAEGSQTAMPLDGLATRLAELLSRPTPRQ